MMKPLWMMWRHHCNDHNTYRRTTIDSKKRNSNVRSHHESQNARATRVSTSGRLDSVVINITAIVVVVVVIAFATVMMMPRRDGDDEWAVGKRSRRTRSGPLGTSLLFVAAQGITTTAAPLRPLNVYAALSMNLLEKVNGAEQSFLADFYLTVGYQEPKLLQWFPANVTAYDGVLLNDTVQIGIDVVALEFTNSVDATAKYSNPTYSWTRPKPIFRSPSVVDDPNIPWVVIDTRYVGTFRASIVLADFPYDTQRLDVHLEMSNKDRTTAVFVINAAYNFMNYAPSLTEWQLLASNTTVTKSSYADFDVQYSRATFVITLRRFSAYYVNKIVIGVIILVLISSGTFFMDTNMADRAAVAATAYLGVVTYLFIVSQDVPKVAYTTRLDSFIAVSQWFIFVNYVLQLLMMFLGSLADQIISNEGEGAAEEAKRVKAKASGDFRNQLLAVVSELLTPADRDSLEPRRSDIYHAKDSSSGREPFENGVASQLPMQRVVTLKSVIKSQRQTKAEDNPHPYHQKKAAQGANAAIDMPQLAGVKKGDKIINSVVEGPSAVQPHADHVVAHVHSHYHHKVKSPEYVFVSADAPEQTLFERGAAFFLAHRRIIDTCLSLSYTLIYAIAALATLSVGR